MSSIDLGFAYRQFASSVSKLALPRYNCHMKSSDNTSLNTLFEEHVLPLFRLPDGDALWQGDSELDTERFVYYFSIHDNEYLLVHESYHGVSDDTLAKKLVGNVVAPYQEVMPVLSKEGSRVHATVARENGSQDPRLRGDFSVFQILH